MATSMEKTMRRRRLMAAAARLGGEEVPEHTGEKRTQQSYLSLSLISLRVGNYNAQITHSDALSARVRPQLRHTPRPHCSHTSPSHITTPLTSPRLSHAYPPASFRGSRRPSRRHVSQERVPLRDAHRARCYPALDGELRRPRLGPARLWGGEHEGRVLALEGEVKRLAALGREGGTRALLVEWLAVHLQWHAPAWRMQPHRAALADAHAVAQPAQREGQVYDVGHPHHLEQPIVHGDGLRLAVHVPEARRERRLPLLVPEVGAAAVGGRVEDHQALEVGRQRDLLAVALEEDALVPVGKAAFRAAWVPPGCRLGGLGCAPGASRRRFKPARVQVGEGVQRKLGRAADDVPELVEEAQLEELGASFGESRPEESRLGVHPDGAVVAQARLGAALGQAAAHLPAVERRDARAVELGELREHALAAEAFAPAQHARQVVARAQREDAHRGAVRRLRPPTCHRRVCRLAARRLAARLGEELLDGGEHPGHGAVAAAHEHAVGGVLGGKGAQCLARRRVGDVDHAHRAARRRHVGRALRERLRHDRA
eukprot:scaffold41220_cov71-Phaeocystis_antarctica.AAC.14